MQISCDEGLVLTIHAGRNTHCAGRQFKSIAMPLKSEQGPSIRLSPPLLRIGLALDSNLLPPDFGPCVLPYLAPQCHSEQLAAQTMARDRNVECVCLLNQGEFLVNPRIGIVYAHVSAHKNQAAVQVWVARYGRSIHNRNDFTPATKRFH